METIFKATVVILVMAAFPAYMITLFALFKNAFYAWEGWQFFCAVLSHVICFLAIARLIDIGSNQRHL